MVRRWELICAHSRLIGFLSTRELERRFAGSLLGWWWSVAFPLAQMATFLLVLQVGLGVTARGDYPLAVALAAGIVAWAFLTEAVVNMTHAISSNSTLLRNSALPVEVFPSASLCAALVTHTIILTLVIIGLAVAAYPPGLTILVLPYAIVCVCAFALPLGIICSVANAAFRDVAQAVVPLLALWFWLTPIVWPLSRIPVDMRWLVELNPGAHIVNAYRFALLGDSASLPSMRETMVFWAMVLLLSATAMLVTKAFRRQLGDML